MTTAADIIARRVAEVEDAHAAFAAAQKVLFECSGRLNSAVANLTAAIAVAKAMEIHKQ